MRSTRRTHLFQRLTLAAATLSVVGLGACSTSGGSDDAAKVTTTTTAPAKAITTTTSKAGSDGSTSTTATGTAPAVTWTSDAQQYRAKIGSTVKIECPPKGTADTIWGVETYTDDSSICTAAVHVGLITLAKGGAVTIEIAPAQKSYDAGTASGITSVRYGSWGGSFTFPDAPPGSGTFQSGTATWGDSAKSLGIAVGESKTVTCPGEGDLSSVWGTDTYTGDSSVCSAAVLQGLITQTKGGPVTVTASEGEDTYQGSTANGVTSSDYGTYDLSFTLAVG